MTEWGREIQVNGVRPAWLADDVKVFFRNDGGFSDERMVSGIMFKNPTYQVTHIRLPADHCAYKALDAGFEPWGGGDTAPDDWDGGDQISRRGEINQFLSWKHPWDGSEGEHTRHDIIGYKKRATPSVVDSKDAVVIQKMTVAEARSASPQYHVQTLRRLGLIREETLAERFTRETGHDVTPAVEAALSWEKGL